MFVSKNVIVKNQQIIQHGNKTKTHSPGDQACILLLIFSVHLLICRLGIWSSVCVECWGQLHFKLVISVAFCAALLQVVRLMNCVWATNYFCQKKTLLIACMNEILIWNGHDYNMPHRCTILFYRTHFAVGCGLQRHLPNELLSSNMQSLVFRISLPNLRKDKPWAKGKVI